MVNLSAPSASQRVERAQVLATVRRRQPDGSYIEETEEVAAFFSVHPEEMRAWRQELRHRQRSKSPLWRMLFKIPGLKLLFKG